MEIKEKNAFIKLMKSKKKNDKKKKKLIPPEQRRMKIKLWTTFYRLNPSIYIKYRLGMNLFPFQHIVLYLMFISIHFCYIANRGIGKSYITACYSMAKAMLYPNSEIGVVASTFGQGKVIIEKMENEICKRGDSPVLKYLYDKGYIKFSYGQDEIKVEFLINNSKIIVMPPTPSARGKRLTDLVVDEFRLIQKNIIDSIFEPMLRSRVAKYITLPEYQEDLSVREEARSIYLSSSGYSTDWLYGHLRRTVNSSYNNNKSIYSFFATDIFVSVKYGLKTQSEFDKQKNSSSDINFRMEHLNEIISEGENSYFSIEEFRKNQILYKSLRPPTYEEYLSKSYIVREKNSNETRILFADFAFASTTSSQSNDNTVLGVLCCYWENDKLVRNVEYIEKHEGGKNPVNRIRELYYMLECDYIVYDQLNGGAIYSLEMTKSYEHPNLGFLMRGFTVCNEYDMQIMSTSKLEDLIDKTVDDMAVPCLIPMSGSSELNSSMWMDLKKKMSLGSIRFLVEESEFENYMSDDSNYLTMDSSLKVLYKLPHVQTMFLCSEMVNLTPKYNGGNVKLEEPRSGFKDSAVALSYGNWIASKLEAKLSKEVSSEDNLDDWSFLSGNFEYY